MPSLVLNKDVKCLLHLPELSSGLAAIAQPGTRYLVRIYFVV
jgi:hypothetical protein